jgi:hypothetical protein
MQIWNEMEVLLHVTLMHANQRMYTTMKSPFCSQHADLCYQDSFRSTHTKHSRKIETHAQYWLRYRRKHRSPVPFTLPVITLHKTVCIYEGGTIIIRNEGIYLRLPTLLVEVRNGAVGWGTALQTERSRVRFPMGSLKLFIDNFSNRSIAPRVDSASNWNEYQGSSLGDKGGRCIGLTTLTPSCADRLKIL